ncbi:MAG: DUF6273 domain-containing protein [bacterium]|nr:DUF6273 domain-containing protein [bacterium]
MSNRNRLKYVVSLMAVIMLLLVSSASAQDPQKDAEANDSFLTAADCEVGSYVRFGRYPQNNADTLEPVEWLVLENNGSTALLISKYALDCKMFHHDANVTWATSDLRKWLNVWFMPKAFTKDEQQCIEETIVDDDWPSAKANGNKSKDKIFCLSAEEADQFFGWDGTAIFFSVAFQPMRYNDKRSCKPTPYAVKRGASTTRELCNILRDTDDVILGNCTYWLRSHGAKPAQGLAVGLAGAVSDHLNTGVMVNFVGVRPALRVKLQ